MNDHKRKERSKDADGTKDDVSRGGVKMEATQKVSKEIIKSLLLLEQEENNDKAEWNKISNEEKSLLHSNHNKHTQSEFDYHSGLQTFYNQINATDQSRRKRSRSDANSAISIAATEIICTTEAAAKSVPSDNVLAAAPGSVTVSANTPHQRRLWVKDRSKAWWDECNNPEYPESDFKKSFRIGKSTFNFICNELNPIIAKEDTMLRTAIPVKQRVAVCIWRLATGEPLRLVSKRFGLGISTCHKLVLEVCSAIQSVLLPKYLHWPPDTPTLHKIKSDFEYVSGIPNIIGSMYTTHIPIVAPKIDVPSYFNKLHTDRNKKTSYSITVQGVVNPNGIFTDVCIGYPGSMSDEQVLERSPLFQRVNDQERLIRSGDWIVGGVNYPLMDWLLVPYNKRNLTWAQHGFNEKIEEIQNVAKDAFVKLKGRWGCLQEKTGVKLEDLPVVFGACCVLHNICEMRGEVMDPVLEVQLFDDEVITAVGIRSVGAMKARDGIAHNLLHHGVAGTGFL